MNSKTSLQATTARPAGSCQSSASQPASPRLAAKRLALGFVSVLAFAASGCDAESGMKNYHDPIGFAVRMPADWVSASPSRGDIAVGDPAGEAVALVRARIAPGDLANWLARGYPRSEPAMRDVQVLQVDSPQPQVARALMRYTNAKGVAKRASVLAVRQGDVATVFVAAAPDAVFMRKLPDITRVLESVRFEAPQAERTEAPRAPRYATWVEPRENAFSLEVPEGWRVNGGLQRTTWNLRVAMSVTSPDGAVEVFIGDPQAPRMFILPTQMILSLGNREGVYSGPDGTMILRYQQARDYGAAFVRNHFRGEPTGASERPDLLELVSRNPLSRMQPSMASAADVAFRTGDGRVGFVGVATWGTITQGVGGNWWADHVQGVIAPQQRMSEAAAVLAHMIASSRWNPRWAAGERQFQATLNQQYQEYQQYSLQLQQRTIEARWESDAAHQRGMRDILGGTVRLRDPVSGESFETAAGDRYFYRVIGADRPTAVGTNADFNPAPQLDMRRLMQVGLDTSDK